VNIVLVLCSTLLASACLTPPAILKASALPLATVLALYPPGTEVRPVPKPDGQALTGLHVPAGPGAPLVLHLIDSSGSAAGAGSDFGVLALQLRELGFASLFVDYTGVGLSTGERSVRNLGPDAEAAWSSALELVEGDPGRVIVRAISIGTIAAAELLEAGARPRAMLWIAPVRPATVVPRFAREFHGFWAWLAATIFYGPVARVEPTEVIAAAGVPVHGIGSSRDRLLSPAEHEELERVGRASGGSWHDLECDHVYLGLRARRMSPEELAILRPLAPPRAPSPPRKGGLAPILDGLAPDLAQRFADGSAARERLAHLEATQPGALPIDLLAAALANDDWVDSWRMLWLHRIRPFPGVELEDRIDALSLRTERGTLKAELVESFSSPHDQAWRYDRKNTTLAPRVVGELAAKHDALYQVRYWLACGLNYEVSFQVGATWELLRIEAQDPDAATVDLARYLLKSLRIPDRLRAGPDGSTRLEALWENRWEPVRLSAP
jgi:hypothetical protein